MSAITRPLPPMILNSQNYGPSFNTHHDSLALPASTSHPFIFLLEQIRHVSHTSLYKLDFREGGRGAN